MNQDSARVKPEPSILLCIIVTGILFAVSYVLFGLRYQTNDDCSMNMMTLGVGVVDHPWPFLLASSSLYGYFICKLQTHFPGLDWYPTIEILLESISTAVLLRRTLALVRNRNSLLIYTLIVFFPLGFLLTHLQFTMISILSATAAFSLEESFLTRPKPLRCATLSALLIAAAGIRYEALIFACLISLPWQLYLGFSIRERLQTKNLVLLTGIFVLALVIVPILGLVALNSEGRHEDLATRLIPYYKIREYGQVQAKDTQAYGPFGWQPADFELFRHFYAPDEELFDSSVLSKMLAVQDTLWQMSSQKLALMKMYWALNQFCWKGALQFLVHQPYLASCLVMSWWLALRLRGSPDRFNFWSFGLSALICFLILGVLDLYFKEPPIRVLLPVLLELELLGLMLLVTTSSKLEPGSPSRALQFMLLVALLFSARDIIKSALGATGDDGKIQSFRSVADALRESGKPLVYICCFPNCHPFEVGSVYNDLKVIFPRSSPGVDPILYQRVARGSEVCTLLMKGQFLGLIEVTTGSFAAISSSI